MSFDVLIIGGGAAGLSCALVLGSAKNKPFAIGKHIGIITHQKTSHLQNALFNNVLGLKPGTLGEDILNDGVKQLHDLYPHVNQIDNEKVISILKNNDGYTIETNRNTYNSAAKEKDRIWLKNTDHLIEKNLYVAGTLAGWRSQFAIASGSGAHVATDILTLWNNGKHTKVHDKK